MKVVLAIFAVAGLLYALHRVALWAEGRGWVYYLNRKPSSSTLGNAFLEIQSMIDPEKRLFVEARKEEAIEEDEWGESLALTIRAEAEGDHAAVRQINLRAFETTLEADLVDAVRPTAQPLVSLVAELACKSHQLPATAVDAPHPAGFSRFGVLDVLSSTTPRPSGRKSRWARHLAALATKPGEKCRLDSAVVGHILFTPVTVRDGETTSSAIGLGPMAVLPELQRRAIGSRLVEAGLEACRKLGEHAVVVLGHADYYPRFGFRPAAQFGLHYRGPDFDPFFFAAELEDGALEGTRGMVEYLPEFENA